MTNEAEERTSLSTEFLWNEKLAELPKQGLRDGAQAWISDGRKASEGAGAGTGLLAYYDSATSSWLTFRGDEAVIT